MSVFPGMRLGDDVELGSHRFTADAIKRFAAAFDPQLFHLDEAAAKASVLGGLCASGWHTVSVFMSLQDTTVRRRLEETVPVGAAVRPLLHPPSGFRDLRWLRPIYAGDFIVFRQRATAVRDASGAPDRFEIDILGHGSKEDDQIAFSLQMTLVVDVP